MAILYYNCASIRAYQICNNDFNLTLHHLHIFGGTLQGDSLFSFSELNMYLLAQRIEIIGEKCGFNTLNL